VSETLGVVPTKYGSISNGHYSFSIHRITIRQLAHIIEILNRAIWLQDESDPNYTLDMILVRYIEFQYLDTGCMDRQRIREEDGQMMIVGQSSPVRAASVMSGLMDCACYRCQLHVWQESSPPLITHYMRIHLSRQIAKPTIERLP
jgi:hypothetical protein